MTPAKTQPGTTTLRDLRLQPRRTPRTPEPDHPQHQELITDSSNAAVLDNYNGTPEGSTETSVFHYTAGLMLSFATPPHRVRLTPNPAFSTTSPTTPTPSSSSTSALGTELTYPTPGMHPSRTTTGGRGALPRPPRATPARPSLSTRPTSPKLTNPDTRDAHHHQPGLPKGRRFHCSGHRRHGIPRRQHNREHPGPRLKGPPLRPSRQHLYSWARPPTRPRQPVSIDLLPMFSRHMIMNP